MASPDLMNMINVASNVLGASGSNANVVGDLYSGLKTVIRDNYNDGRALRNWAAKKLYKSMSGKARRKRYRKTYADWLNIADRNTRYKYHYI